MFRNKFFVSFVLVLVFLFLFSVSSVSADEYYFSSGNITNDSFQGVINNSTPDEVIINLDDGEYSLGQINITRNATIKGNSSNVKINGSGGVLFSITASNVKLINLTITGFDNFIVSNSGDLTVIGNNVTTSGISISISSSGGNLSNILIEDNVITSNSYGVDITLSGINNLTFDGNNITGTYAVRLSVSNSNNTNITFANNNITGTGGDNDFSSVDLSVSNSNNTNITFANNNITGPRDYQHNYGVSLGVSNSNNTNISFDHNNITGTYGVSLGASGSNNTNISFDHNNITGLYYGVDLYAYSSNNTNISFDHNNITVVDYGVYVYSNDGNVSGVFFLNNTVVEGKSWDEIDKLKLSNGVVWGYGGLDPSSLYHQYYGGFAGNNYDNPAFYDNPIVNQHMESALSSSNLESSYNDWSMVSWDGSNGISPKGDAVWLWTVFVDYPYFVDNSLDISENTTTIQPHGGDIFGNIYDWKRVNQTG